MKIDHEIIKDAICLADPTVSRKNIIFENVYVYDNIILVQYRELVWSNTESLRFQFRISIEEYEKRLKQKQRESNLKADRSMTTDKVMWSLDCCYYEAEFPTIGDLIAHIMISGMDPNYEITCNGKGIGEKAVDYITF